MDTAFLNELLECSVCLEQLDMSSRVLPCQHTFCKRCLQEIVQAKGELRCPECRTLVEVKVDELPVNIFLVRLLEGIKNNAPRRWQPGTSAATSCVNSQLPVFSTGGGCTPVRATLGQASFCWAKAIYSYEATTADELSFQRGDLIGLTRRIDANWYEAELRGRMGCVPAACISVVAPLTPQQAGGNGTTAQSSLPAMLASQASLSHVAQPMAKALYDFQITDKSAEEKECLTFTRGELIYVLRRIDENWAEGRAVGDRQGIFPISFVEMNLAAKQLIKFVTCGTAGVGSSASVGVGGVGVSGCGGLSRHLAAAAPPALTGAIPPSLAEPSGVGGLHIGQKTPLSSQAADARYVDPAATVEGKRQSMASSALHLPLPAPPPPPQPITSASTMEHSQPASTPTSSGSMLHLGADLNAFTQMEIVSLSGSNSHPPLLPFLSKGPSPAARVSVTPNVVPSPALSGPLTVPSTLLSATSSDAAVQQQLPSAHHQQPPQQQHQQHIYLERHQSSVTTTDARSPRVDGIRNTRPKDDGNVAGGGGCITSSAQLTSSQLAPLFYVALYNYKPQMDDELELRKGDVYLVSEKCQDGWFKGSAHKSGAQGVFPGNYVQPALSSAGLLRQHQRSALLAFMGFQPLGLGQRMEQPPQSGLKQSGGSMTASTQGELLQNFASMCHVSSPMRPRSNPQFSFGAFYGCAQRASEWPPVANGSSSGNCGGGDLSHTFCPAGGPTPVDTFAGVTGSLLTSATSSVVNPGGFAPKHVLKGSLHVSNALTQQPFAAYGPATPLKPGWVTTRNESQNSHQHSELSPPDTQDSLPLSQPSQSSLLPIPPTFNLTSQQQSARLKQQPLTAVEYQKHLHHQHLLQHQQQQQQPQLSVAKQITRHKSKSPPPALGLSGVNAAGNNAANVSVTAGKPAARAQGSPTTHIRSGSCPTASHNLGGSNGQISSHSSSHSSPAAGPSSTLSNNSAASSSSSTSSTSSSKGNHSSGRSNGISAAGSDVINQSTPKAGAVAVQHKKAASLDQASALTHTNIGSPFTAPHSASLAGTVTPTVSDEESPAAEGEGSSGQSGDLAVSAPASISEQHGSETKTCAASDCVGNVTLTTSAAGEKASDLTSVEPDAQHLTPKQMYRCTVPYPANSDYELELEVGDVVHVHKKREDGWCKGTLQRTGETGLFRAPFLKQMSTAAALPPHQQRQQRKVAAAESTSLVVQSSPSTAAVDVPVAPSMLSPGCGSAQYAFLVAPTGQQSQQQQQQQQQQQPSFVNSFGDRSAISTALGTASNPSTYQCGAPGPVLLSALRPADS